MSKKTCKLIGILIGCLGIILFACYLFMSWYYRDGFSYGTWINGIYCTGKSVDEVNEELLHTYQYEGLLIQDKEGTTFLIPAEEVAFQFDFKESLQRYRKEQNAFLWIDQLVGSNRNHVIKPVTTYDEKKCISLIQDLPIVQKELNAGERKVFISRNETGYQLVNEREMVLDTAKLEEVILKALQESETFVDLKNAGCYTNLELTEEMEQTIGLWKKVSSFQDCGIIYQMGNEQVKVDAAVVADWIKLEEDQSFSLDEEGNLILLEDGPANFIKKLADTYDTVGKSRTFMATRGERITVEGGIYGNELDQKTETEYLKQAFLDHSTEIHVPAYLKMAKQQGKEDIGSTYIEIDMTNQMLYYYVEGSIQIQTPVVTGNISLHRGTPVGVNYVYNKQKNRVLRGPGYASPVKYWIPVKGGIGIHDSSWRKEYGGEIYKTAGSHGCINTPLEEVAQLYDMVEIGTPVVMFY